MNNLQEIINLMQNLEDQLVVCMRCGMCQAVCPLFAATGRETDVARGKLALLDGLLQQMFEDPRGVFARLDKCLLCGSCAANCPSGVNVLEIFIKSRAILVGFMGLPPSKRLVLRGLLAHPGIFDRLTEWGAKFQSIFTKSANEVLGTSCARFESPLLADRHFRPLAKTPFHKMVASRTTTGNGTPRVALFTGCLIDKIFPNIAQATLSVLEHHQIGIFLPPGQGCCGIPAASAGDTKTFTQLVKHNAALFDPAEYDCLVTACATCTSTIKEVWPMMATQTNPDIKDRIDLIASKTMDINQFLVQHIDLKQRTDDWPDNAQTVTYHDPCHLKKGLGVTMEPRKLISNNSAYRLEEMAESDWCCGMGGSFNLNYYDISSQIAQRKQQNILDTACDVIATGCPACMLQLSDTLSKAGAAVAIKHPVEIYQEIL